MVVEEFQSKRHGRGYSLASEKTLPQTYLYNHNSNGNQTPEISIIMPAFNEERAVGALIDRTKQILQNITKNYEIIVIDDGSEDQTLHICREKHVTIIHNRRNCGKGYALREGFKFARGDILLTIDSDGDHHPEEIPLLLRPLIEGKVDVVLGTRFNNGDDPVTTVINTFGNRLFNMLIRRLTHHHFTDTQCGFRAFKKSCLVTLNLESSGYELETEMIVKVARQNISYCEIPVSSPITYFHKSNINRVLDGLRILRTIFYTRLKKMLKE